MSLPEMDFILYPLIWSCHAVSCGFFHFDQKFSCIKLLEYMIMVIIILFFSVCFSPFPARPTIRGQNLSDIVGAILETISI